MGASQPPLACRDRDTGAVAVEFALIAPLFFMVVFGILTLGRALHTQLELSTGAQEGARVMYTGGTETSARAAVSAAAAVTPALGDAEISVTPSSCSSGTQLHVVAKRPVELNWIFVTKTVTIAGEGVIRCP